MMVLVNGHLCAIQLRKGGKTVAKGRLYARFDATQAIKKAKFALWAIRDRLPNVYVVPVSQLRNIPYVYIPKDGKYDPGTYRKPRRDWTQFDGTWHLIASVNPSGQQIHSP